MGFTPLTTKRFPEVHLEVKSNAFRRERQCTAIILSLHYMFLKKRANMILEGIKSRQKYWRHGHGPL